MIRKPNIIVKLVAIALLIAFSFENILWANPEVLQRNTFSKTLQVPSFFSSDKNVLKAMLLCLVRIFPDIENFKYRLTPTVAGMALDLDFSRMRKRKNRLLIPCFVGKQEYKVVIDLTTKDVHVLRKPGEEKKPSKPASESFSVGSGIFGESTAVGLETEADLVYNAFSVNKADIQPLGEASACVPIEIEGYDSESKGRLLLLVYNNQPVAVLRENKMGFDTQYRFSVGFLAKNFRIEKEPACKWIKAHFSSLIGDTEDSDINIRGLRDTAYQYETDIAPKTQRKYYGLPFIYYFRGVFVQGFNSTIPMIEILRGQKTQDKRFQRVLDIACGAGELGLASIEKLNTKSVVVADSDVFALLSTMLNFERAGRRNALKIVYGCLKEQSTWDRLREQGPYDYVLSNGPFPVTDSDTRGKDYVMYDQGGKIKRKFIDNISSLIGESGTAQVLSDKDFGTQIEKRGFKILHEQTNAEGIHFYIIGSQACTPAAGKKPAATDSAGEEDVISGKIATIDEYYRARELDGRLTSMRQTEEGVFAPSPTEQVVQVGEYFLKGRKDARALDCGSGTGKAVTLLSLRASYVKGVEINLNLLEQSIACVDELNDQDIVDKDNIQLVRGTFWDEDFSHYDLIYIYWPYSASESNRMARRLERKLLRELKPDAVFVINCNAPKKLKQFKILERIGLPHKEKNISPSIKAYKKPSARPASEFPGEETAAKVYAQQVKDIVRLCDKEFKPKSFVKASNEVGRFVPTPTLDALIILRYMHSLNPSARICDLGSGNGKFCFLAVCQFHSVAGIELRRDLDNAARRIQRMLASGIPKAGNIDFVHGNFFEKDLSQYDILYFFYTLPGRYEKMANFNNALREKLLSPTGLKPGGKFIVLFGGIISDDEKLSHEFVKIGTTVFSVYTRSAEPAQPEDERTHTQSGAPGITHRKFNPNLAKLLRAGKGRTIFTTGCEVSPNNADGRNDERYRDLAEVVKSDLPALESVPLVKINEGFPMASVPFDLRNVINHEPILGLDVIPSKIEIVLVDTPPQRKSTLFRGKEGIIQVAHAGRGIGDDEDRLVIYLDKHFVDAHLENISILRELISEEMAEELARRNGYDARYVHNHLIASGQLKNLYAEYRIYYRNILGPAPDFLHRNFRPDEQNVASGKTDAEPDRAPSTSADATVGKPSSAKATAGRPAGKKQPPVGAHSGKEPEWFFIGHSDPIAFGSKTNYILIIPKYISPYYELANKTFYMERPDSAGSGRVLIYPTQNDAMDRVEIRISGRRQFTLPKEYRNKLDDKHVVFAGIGDCIALYTAERWNRELQEIDAGYKGNLRELLDRASEELEKESDSFSGQTETPTPEPASRSGAADILPMRFCAYSDLPDSFKTDQLYALYLDMDKEFGNDASNNLRYSRLVCEITWVKKKDKEYKDAIIAFIGNKPVAIWGFAIFEKDKISWDEGVYVDEDHRKKRIATALYDALLDYLKKRRIRKFKIGNIDNDHSDSAPIRKSAPAQRLQKSFIERNPHTVTSEDIKRDEKDNIVALTIALDEYTPGNSVYLGTSGAGALQESKDQGSSMSSDPISLDDSPTLITTPVYEAAPKWLKGDKWYQRLGLGWWAAFHWKELPLLFSQPFSFPTKKYHDNKNTKDIVSRGFGTGGIWASMLASFYFGTPYLAEHLLYNLPIPVILAIGLLFSFIIVNGLMHGIYNTLATFMPGFLSPLTKDKGKKPDTSATNDKPANPESAGEQVWENEHADIKAEELPREKLILERERIKGFVRTTPLIPLRLLSEITGKKVLIKDESCQLGGSFKARGVTAEVFYKLEKLIKEKPYALDNPFFIVTQTDGNHGQATIAATILAISHLASKYPALKSKIKNIEPRIYVIENVSRVKKEAMELALAQYRVLVGDDSKGDIKFDCGNYKEASQHREQFIEDHSDTSVYIEHGGPTIMAGHGSAGFEIAEQLKQMSLDGKKICLIIPVGAGGPLGVGAALKASGLDASVVMVQSRGLDAFVRSLKLGRIVENPDHVEPTTWLNIDGVETPVIFSDGIAVNGPESEEAVSIASQILDAAVSVDDRRAFNQGGPHVFLDLQNNPQIGDVAVGGTTALTAQALLDYGDIKAIKDAEVVVLFGTEGNVLPEIIQSLQEKANQLNRDTSDKPAPEPASDPTPPDMNGPGQLGAYQAEPIDDQPLLKEISGHISLREAQGLSDREKQSLKEYIAAVVEAYPGHEIEGWKGLPKIKLTEDRTQQSFYAYNDEKDEITINIAYIHNEKDFVLIWWDAIAEWYVANEHRYWNIDPLGFSQMFRDQTGAEYIDFMSHRRALSQDFVMGRRVLEIGCASGACSIITAEHGAQEVVGIDIAEKLLEIARAESGRRKLSNVHFERRNVFDMGFPPDQTFDRVIVTQFFHDLPDRLREKALDQIRHVLTPDGKLGIVASRRLSQAEGGEYPHPLGWNEAEWRRELEQRGFANVQIVIMRGRGFNYYDITADIKLETTHTSPVSAKATAGKPSSADATAGRPAKRDRPLSPLGGLARCCRVWWGFETAGDIDAEEQRALGVEQVKFGDTSLLVEHVALQLKKINLYLPKPMNIDPVEAKYTNPLMLNCARVILTSRKTEVPIDFLFVIDKDGTVKVKVLNGRKKADINKDEMKLLIEKVTRKTAFLTLLKTLQDGVSIEEILGADSKEPPAASTEKDGGIAVSQIGAVLGEHPSFNEQVGELVEKHIQYFVDSGKISPEEASEFLRKKEAGEEAMLPVEKLATYRYFADRGRELWAVYLPEKQLGFTARGEPFTAHLGLKQGVIWVASEREDIDIILDSLHEVEEYNIAWERAKKSFGGDMKVMAVWRDDASYEAQCFFHNAHKKAWLRLTRFDPTSLESRRLRDYVGKLLPQMIQKAGYFYRKTPKSDLSGEEGKIKTQKDIDKVRVEKQGSILIASKENLAWPIAYKLASSTRGIRKHIEIKEGLCFVIEEVVRKAIKHNDDSSKKVKISWRVEKNKLKMDIIDENRTGLPGEEIDTFILHVLEGFATKPVIEIRNERNGTRYTIIMTSPQKETPGKPGESFRRIVPLLISGLALMQVQATGPYSSWIFPGLGLLAFVAAGILIFIKKREHGAAREEYLKKVREKYDRLFSQRNFAEGIILSEIFRNEPTRTALCDEIGAGNNGKSLLSIGIGSGVLEEELVEKYGLSITGVDIVPSLVNRAGNKGLNAILVKDGQDLSDEFGDESFDIIVLSESIGYMDLDKVLAEAHRLLKPGGTVHITSYASSRYLDTEIAYSAYGAKDILSSMGEAGFRGNEEAPLPQSEVIFYVRGTKPRDKDDKGDVLPVENSPSDKELGDEPVSFSNSDGPEEVYQVSAQAIVTESAAVKNDVPLEKIDVSLEEVELFLRDISEPEGLTRSAAEKILSILLPGKKLVMVFDSGIGAMQSASPMTVIRRLRELKRDPRFKKLLKNLIIIETSPEKIHNKIQKYYGEEDTEVLIFARKTERKSLKKLESKLRVNSFYIEDGAFNPNARYPLLEIVTIALGKHLRSLDSVLSGLEKMNVNLNSLNIKSIDATQTGALIFTLLEKPKEFNKQELIKYYANQKRLLIAA